MQIEIDIIRENGTEYELKSFILNIFHLFKPSPRETTIFGVKIPIKTNIRSSITPLNNCLLLWQSGSTEFFYIDILQAKIIVQHKTNEIIGNIKSIPESNDLIVYAAGTVYMLNYNENKASFDEKVVLLDRCISASIQSERGYLIISRNLSTHYLFNYADLINNKNYTPKVFNGDLCFHISNHENILLMEYLKPRKNSITKKLEVSNKIEIFNLKEETKTSFWLNLHQSMRSFSLSEKYISGLLEDDGSLLTFEILDDTLKSLKLQ